MSKRDELLIEHLDNAVKKLHSENEKLKDIIRKIHCPADGCAIEAMLCPIRKELFGEEDDA